MTSDVNATAPVPAPVAVLVSEHGRHTLDAPMPVMEVYLLGPFRVVLDGVTVEDWPGGRVRSLFQRLALDPSHGWPRDALAAACWPGREPAAARNNLNVALHAVRRLFAAHRPGVSVIEHHRGRYGLSPALRPWVDVQAFETAIQAGRVAEGQGDEAQAERCWQLALDLYAGDLLAGEPYEDWCAEPRRAMRLHCAAAAARLAERCWSRGDVEACAAAAGRLLQLDGCDEAAHRWLMRCHARRDHVHLAIRQFHSCVDLLQRDLRLIPSPQTVALYREIRERRAP